MLARVFSKIEKFFNITMPDLYTIPYEERTKNDIHVFHFDLSDVTTFYEQRCRNPWNHSTGKYLMDKLVHGIDISVDTFVLIHYETLVRIPANPEREGIIYYDDDFYIVPQERDDDGNIIYEIQNHPLRIKAVDLHGFLFHQNSPFLPWIKYGFRNGCRSDLSIKNIKQINEYTVESEEHKLRVRQDIRDFVRAVYKSFKESRIPQVRTTAHMIALLQFPANVSAAITFINQSTGIRARRAEFLDFFTAYYIHGIPHVNLTDRAAVYATYRDLKDFGKTHYLEGGFNVHPKKDIRCRCFLDILRMYKNKHIKPKDIKEFREYSEEYGAKDEFVLITKDEEREEMTFDYFFDRVIIGEEDWKVLTVEEYERERKE